MIAHRGVSGLELENTCAAFVAAGNRSYFGIETDVHVTADGKFIIIHDSNTQRVATEAMVAEESTFEVLRGIRLKEADGTLRCDLRLPSLEEYWQQVNKDFREPGVPVRRAWSACMHPQDGVCLEVQFFFFFF